MRVQLKGRNKFCRVNVGSSPDDDDDELTIDLCRIEIVLHCFTLLVTKFYKISDEKLA